MLSTRFGPLVIDHDERVLPPREWTTAQALWAARLLADGPPGPVLELCSGAGQIGLLTTVLSGRPITLVDRNPVACAFARSNARAAGLDHLVEVHCRALEQVSRPEGGFALVLADPPWVRSADVDRFPGDPPSAIDGGEDGLRPARQCLTVAANVLHDQGSLLLQLGTTGQVAAVDDWLLARPAMRLTVVEHRAYGEHGVLVRLTRRPASRSDH